PPRPTELTRASGLTGGSAWTADRLVDDGPVARGRDRLALHHGHIQPQVPGDQHLLERLLWCAPVRRAVLQIGYVGDIAVVFVTPEDVDVIVLHASFSSRGWYCSTKSRNCRPPLGPLGHASGARRAASTRSGVMGRVVTLAPVAWRMALAIAGAVG